jgi:hypothetical protein
MSPWGLVIRKVFGPQRPSLTNRMSELLKYGSVGGVGRKPGPYPAGQRRSSLLVRFGRRGSGVPERGRYP